MDKVSIHVTVLYRHASLEYDGVSSTAEKPEVIKEYIFAISGDVTQDHNFILHIQKLISDYLKDKVGIQITKMHKFIDGCAGQYKSRHCFRDLPCLLQNLSYVAQRKLNIPLPRNISVTCSIIKTNIITCKVIFLFHDMAQLNIASIVSDIQAPIFGAKLAKMHAVR